MASYQYDTLPKDAFRLLTIVDDKGPVIQCTLSTFSLNDPPAYMALSYTWGSALPGDGLTADLDHTLLCDGAEIAITASLENALLSVPLTQEYIWADAVCINQQDLAERSAQVALMGKIYSYASQVTVWLGVADRSTQTAFDFIHDFASRVPEDLPGDQWDEVQVDQYFSDPELWDRLGRPKWTAAERHALIWLFLRNWFTRTWVIQEAVFASDAVVLCGSNSAPWRSLWLVSELAQYRNLTSIAVQEVAGAREFLTMHDGYFMPIAAIPSEIVSLKIGCRDIPLFISGHNEKRDHEVANLLHGAIRVTRNLRATELKDKIFAPIALVLHVFPIEDIIARLRPDYSKSTAQVFTEVSSFLLQHDALPGKSYFISMAGNATPARVEGLPSWVQDYSVPEDKTIILDDDCNFNCLAGISQDNNLEFTPSGPTLRLCTSRFDTLSELVLLPFLPIRQRRVAELLPLLQFAAGLPDFDARGEPAILSMIHSITANGTREYDDRSAYDKFREKFTQFFYLAASRGHISVDEILAPESTFSRLLNDFEGRMITAFPTYIELRNGVEDLGSVQIPEDQAFEFMMTTDRQAFLSTEGYVGIVPITAQSGDEIMFLPGSPVPFVFRKMDQPGEYKLVGEAYVHGIMYGELWRERLQPEWSPLTLV